MKEEMKEVTVDFLKVNKFTESHLKTVREIYKDHWEKFYPELYGDTLPDAIRFVGFELMGTEDRTLGQQVNRAGGRTVKAKYLEIKQNIERNGFKLKYPPISWFRWANNPGDEVTITGDTREEILSRSPFLTKNLIVAIYERNEGFSDEQVQDAIDCCGLRFNAIHDPAAPVSIADVKRSVNLAIQRYIDTGGTAGVAPTIDEITKRVDYVCGEGIFQPGTRMQLIFEIYNNFNPHDIIISWSDAVKAKYRISTFMQRNKLVDTNEVKYIYNSFELYSKAFTRACKKAAKFPDAEIRIVIHTGTLKGFTMSKIYIGRIRKFLSEFNSIKQAVSDASDQKATFERIKFYGALPALGSIHDVETPFIFNERTDMFYQKSIPYTFDAVEDDTEELDEVA